MKITFLISFLLLSLLTISAQENDRYEMLSGVKKSSALKGHWDKKFSDKNYLYGKKPAKFLEENYHYIPEGARVLDVAMSEGRNGVFLARKGYKVVGVDISSVALEKSKELAREYKVEIETVLSPMEKYEPGTESFDAIICYYYIDKKLNKKFFDWLKPGGILFYESHTTRQRKVKGHEKYELSYLLQPAELLTMFPEFRVLKYEEPLHVGEFTSSIILQKPVREKPWTSRSFMKM